MVSAKGADYDLLLDMRRATRRAHSIANALILSKLVVALTDRKLYARALSTFLPVYEALEAAMHTATDVPGLKQLTAIAQRIPSRAAALEQDLVHLLGPGWRALIPANAAAEMYAQHLRQLADRDPVLLLPYVFSLHVPILLGFMSRRIGKALGLAEGDDGLAFFTLPDKAATLAAMRAAVTAAGRSPAISSPETRAALVAEAVEQFRRNNAVVAEFALGWPAVGAALRRGVGMVPSWAYCAGAAAAAAALVGAAALASTTAAAA